MNQSTPDNTDKKETDLLVYRGSSVPAFIKLVWAILILFCIYYLAQFMWPDLQTWLSKSAS